MKKLLTAVLFAFSLSAFAGDPPPDTKTNTESKTTREDTMNNGDTKTDTTNSKTTKSTTKKDDAKKKDTKSDMTVPDSTK